MQVPNTKVSTYVKYSVDNSEICSISGTKNTAQITAISPGTTNVHAQLIASSTGVVQASAEMMVYVKEAEKIGDFLRIIEANPPKLSWEDFCYDSVFNLYASVDAKLTCFFIKVRPFKTADFTSAKSCCKFSIEEIMPIFFFIYYIQKFI